MPAAPKVVEAVSGATSLGTTTLEQSVSPGAVHSLSDGSPPAPPAAAVEALSAAFSDERAVPPITFAGSHPKPHILVAGYASGGTQQVLYWTPVAVAAAKHLFAKIKNVREGGSGGVKAANAFDWKQFTAGYPIVQGMSPHGVPNMLLDNKGKPVSASALPVATVTVAGSGSATGAAASSSSAAASSSSAAASSSSAAAANVQSSPEYGSSPRPPTPSAEVVAAALTVSPLPPEKPLSESSVEIGPTPTPEASPKTSEAAAQLSNLGGGHVPHASKELEASGAAAAAASSSAAAKPPPTVRSRSKAVTSEAEAEEEGQSHKIA